MGNCTVLQVDYGYSNGFIGPISELLEIAQEEILGLGRLSGMGAVKKIVETEGQARRIVEEAKVKAKDIVSRAHGEADRVREEALTRVQMQREEMLKEARVKAEEEARQSDLETEKLLDNYRRQSEERKAEAVIKAVELVLGA